MAVSKPLFNPRVLERELSQLRKRMAPPASALQTVRSWAERIEDGLLDGYTETQIEQAFVSAFFVEVLEYRHLGEATAHILPKRTGLSGRDIPDVVLGVFNAGAGIERWHAVCEVKGLSVSLDAPQTSRHNRETPVQQAFRYAVTGQPGVEWVIVTNFREIRLYRNGYIGAFQRWTLQDLLDEDRFFEFWGLLRQPHLAPEDAESETLRILRASVEAGLALTEGFYGVYDLARQRLAFALQNDPAFAGQGLSSVLGKAHKLLNRVLFAAFCEDHPAKLLPPGTLSRLHRDAEADNASGAYWKTFLRFFTELDRGSPPGSPNGFNAFNGGLFAPDPLLDSVSLSDSLFRLPLVYKHSRRQSREIQGVFGFFVYDFSTELDVDSLGAIFEQSLKDLPHAAAAVRGHGQIELTRRENKGVYYTAPSITNYLVGRCVDEHLQPFADTALREVSEAKVESRKSKRSLSAEDTRDLLYFRKYMEHLRGLTVVDPACGSGAFLIAAFRRLHDEYDRTNAALAQLRGAQPLFGLDRLILRDNLFGVDILAESVEISKLSLWLRTASRDEPLEKLDQNLVCADTLAFESGRVFDIAVSNPPWGAELDGWSDEQLLEQFPAVGSEKDSAAIFVLRTFDLLAPGGVLGFVLPNSWLTVAGYQPFRQWLLQHTQLIEITHLWKIFADVNHDACLLILRKPHGKEDRRTPTRVRALSRGISETEKHQLLAEERFAWDFEVDPNEWKDEPASRFETVYEPMVAKELSRAASRCAELGKLFDVTVGIQVYHQRNVSKEIIETRAFHAEYRKGQDWFPFISGNEVQRYFEVPSESAFLLYSDQLCDKRELQHYKEPRILVQQIFWNRLSASLSYPEEPSLYLNTLFSITRPKTPLSLPALMVILNSRFISGAYERFANRIFGDKFPKVSKLDLARLPIPKVSGPDAEKLGQLGAELQTKWQQLKRGALGFREAVCLSEESGRLAVRLNRYWTLERQEAGRLIAKTNMDIDSKEALLGRWITAKELLAQSWAEVTALESQAESLVAELYGVKPAVYERVIARAVEPSLDDLLLPR